MVMAAFSSTTKSYERAPKKASWVAFLLLAPGITYMLVFFALPFVQLGITALQAPAEGGGIGRYVSGLEFSNFLVAAEQYWPQFLRSFIYAFVSTVVCLIICYPLAYLIGVRARSRPVWQGVMLILVAAPFFISYLLRTLAWKSILPSEWLGTDFSVIFGLVYNSMPFMVLPIFASLQALDLRLVEAGSDLYATPMRTFRQVTFPISLPGVIAGTLLTFIPLTGEYVNASMEFLGSINTVMIGNVISSNFLQTQNFPIASALSIILLVLMLLAVTPYVRKSGTENLL